MRDNRKLEKALAFIIACTRRVKRPKDIVSLAKNISYAARWMGGLEGVAEAVRLSVQQLKDFLAVEDLCPDVKALVARRAIDSVDVVKTIGKLEPKKQKALAEHFVNGRIASRDVRAITTFAKKFPDKPITKVIADYEKSRDVKVYVAQFRIPRHFGNRPALRKRFEEIVGKSEIIRLGFEGGVAVLEVTVLGHKKLREAVRKKRVTLRKFVGSIVEEVMSRK